MIGHKTKLAYSTPFLFAALTLVLCSESTWAWPRRWLVSGTPLLQLLLHLGDVQNRRVLPSLHLWPLLSTLHLSYAICSTSWLLYGAFTALCYWTILLVSLFQFDRASNIARRVLRKLIYQLHFIDDKVAFFNIPALEINTDVAGLMVVRGITFSLSTLVLVVHGIEVGIKLSDDVELAVQTEQVRVKLFRSIEIGDCFANLKGGELEMTFDHLEPDSKGDDGDAVFVEDTPLLKAAAPEGDRRSTSMSTSTDDGTNGLKVPGKRPPMIQMASRMTDGRPPEDGSAQESFEAIDMLPLDNTRASGKYDAILRYIQDTNAIHEARTLVTSTTALDKDKDEDKDKDIRAAICSYLQQTTSVPHPPQLSIKVTTLRNLVPPTVRRLMHRLPFLLRLLLHPLSSLHPVTISALTASASGRWVDHVLVETIFKDYAEGSAELRATKRRIGHWLRHAHFTAELGAVAGRARVPLAAASAITTELAAASVLAYRALPAEAVLDRVASLGGADTRLAIPSFLLPHHDHLLPPRPPAGEAEDGGDAAIALGDAGGGDPRERQAQRALGQGRSDEAYVKISVHARLPAVLDQALLDFIAALVKASKIAEFERLAEEGEGDEGDDDQARSQTEEEAGDKGETEKGRRGIKERSAALKTRFKGSMKRTLVDNAVSDRWVAKLVGRITARLEGAMGEAGYSGVIPVRLEAYRTGECEREGEKLLP